MVADLREMQENQWVSEIQIDKFRFINLFNHLIKLQRIQQKSPGNIPRRPD